jgi:hypothetical protein
MFYGGLTNAALLLSHRSDMLLAVFAMVIVGVVVGVVSAVFLSKDDFKIPDREMRYLHAGVLTINSILFLVMAIVIGQRRLSLILWAGFLAQIPVIVGQLIPRDNRFRRVVAVTGVAGGVAWLSILVTTFLRWPAS